MRPTEPRVYLERPDSRHQRDFLDACHRSRALHRGLVAAPATAADYRDYLELAARVNQESFVVMAADNGELAGVVNILDIVRDAPSAGRLAYFAFLPRAASGLMREGVGQVIDMAFRELELSRLDADIQPGNRRSREFAARLGFCRGGEQHVLLKIGSRWRAHERWTMSRDEWRSGRHELVARA